MVIKINDLYNYALNNDNEYKIINEIKLIFMCDYMDKYKLYLEKNNANKNIYLVLEFSDDDSFTLVGIDEYDNLSNIAITDDYLPMYKQALDKLIRIDLINDILTYI